MSIICMTNHGDCVEVACDSRGTYGSIKADYTKFFYKDGWFVCFAGAVPVMHFLKHKVNWCDLDKNNYHEKLTDKMLEIKKSHFDDDSFSCQFMATNGSLCIYGDDNFCVNQIHDFFCAGSGSEVAWGWVEEGSTLIGCEKAAMIDDGCGLPVHHFVFDKDDRMSYNLVYTSSELQGEIKSDGMMHDFYKIVQNKSGRPRD